MLKRKIMNELYHWKEQFPNKAICIFGARQIGKTTSLLQFANENFEKVILLNFLTFPEAKTIFSDSLDPEKIFMQIELLTKTTIIPKKTMIIFDEIQECPNARTAVKFLVEDGRARIGETGSLLGVRIEGISSIPVGYEMPVSMYPLDFEEFLWGASVSDEIIDLLKRSIREKKTIPEFIHERMLEYFHQYIVIGGMPEVCQRYFDHHNFEEAIETQKTILNTYRNDIIQYADRNDRVRILEVFEQIPAQLNKQNLRFFLNQITGSKNPRFSQYENCLYWITEAGLALPSFNVEEPQIPLKLNEKRNLFRLFFLDTGLLCSNYERIQISLLQGDLSINWGSILENAVAQSLTAQNIPLYYFNTKKFGEIDFVCQIDQHVHLVEIKSGNDYKKHSALSKVASVSNWVFDQSFVFCKGNIEEENGILYLPYYLIGFLHECFHKQVWPDFSLEPFSFHV